MKNFKEILLLSIITIMGRYESKKREMPYRIMVKYADYLGYEFKLMVK